MLQQDSPEDFVIATGESHSVRDLVEIAFGHVGLDYNDFIELDPALYRPAEVDHLRGDYSKARKTLGWQPRLSFADLIRLMVDCDLRLLQSDKGASSDIRLTADSKLLDSSSIVSVNEPLQP